MQAAVEKRTDLSSNIIKFCASIFPNVALTPELAAQQGEQRGTNNPTALFGRTDFVLTEANTLDVQYAYARFRGENFNLDTARPDTAVDSAPTRSPTSARATPALADVANPLLITCPSGFFPERPRERSQFRAVDCALRRRAASAARRAVYILEKRRLKYAAGGGKIFARFFLFFDYEKVRFDIFVARLANLLRTDGDGANESMASGERRPERQYQRDGFD